MLNLDESAAVQSPHEQIIDALRAELQEYGSLLNLFDQQQEVILNREPDPITEVGLTIWAQQATLRARRSHRKNLISALTPNSGLQHTPLQAVLLFPQPMRPLVEALSTEVNRLIGLVRHRSQQNQALLARTIGVGAGTV